MIRSEPCTFYGGGHRGTEAEFGRMAERFGIHEVNYSFEGHQPERQKGLVMLSSEELRKGDISMEIVSFVGTGTRNLTEAGRAAIEDLFTRSFGA
jgi:hypothetical protein